MHHTRIGQYIMTHGITSFGVSTSHIVLQDPKNKQLLEYGGLDISIWILWTHFEVTTLYYRSIDELISIHYEIVP